MKQLQRFGVVLFKQDERAIDVLRDLYHWSKARSISVVLHPAVPSEMIPEPLTVAADESQFLEQCDAILSIGGDGTLLTAVHIGKFSSLPVIGINLGSVGFLADIDSSQVIDSLDQIVAGNYDQIERMVLDVTVRREGVSIATMSALNDVYINRSSVPRLVSVKLWYGEDYITDYIADGVIIATPSGSTAYSLAAGGPIVAPGLTAVVITPICPHSISERPIVLDSSRPIRMKINAKNPSPLLSADGLHSQLLQPDDEVTISFNGRYASIIQLTHYSYFDTLRTKLNWGSGTKEE